MFLARWLFLLLLNLGALLLKKRGRSSERRGLRMFPVFGAVSTRPAGTPGPKVSVLAFWLRRSRATPKRSPNRTPRAERRRLKPFSLNFTRENRDTFGLAAGSPTATLCG